MADSVVHVGLVSTDSPGHDITRAAAGPNCLRFLPFLRTSIYLTIF